MPDEQFLFTCGKATDDDLLDENESYRTTVETLGYELNSIGVIQEQANHVAAFLMAAYSHKLPLLFIGPRGQWVADAFSVSMFGKTAAVLDAGGAYDPRILKQAEESQENVICVKNLFSGAWLIPMIEMLEKTDRYFVFVHPFADDLQIEPEGVFHYLHPLFTDAFLQDAGDIHTLCGGKKASHYEEFQPEFHDRYGFKEQYLPVSHMANQRIRHVLSDTLQILGNETAADVPYLFGYFPYLAAVGRWNDLSAMLAGETNLTDNAEQYMLNYLSRQK